MVVIFLYIFILSSDKNNLKKLNVYIHTRKLFTIVDPFSCYYLAGNNFSEPNLCPKTIV